MRMCHRIIILALLFLVPEKSNSRILIPLPMQISDALPVQFWLTGCATFNEHYAPGVFHKCFCAPWECDDEIRIQFTDNPAQVFSLEIYSIDDELIGTVDFDEVYTGVYEVILNLSEDSPDVCDQLIYLQIKRNQGLQGITLPSLNSWQNSGGAGEPWTLGSNPSRVISGLGTTSEYLYVDYAFIPGVTYVINAQFNLTAPSAGIFSIVVLDNSFTEVFDQNTTIDVAGDIDVNPLVFVATADSVRVGFIFTAAVGGATLSINSVGGSRTVGDSETVAKSDCLDIRENHEQSVLLTYSNHRNFAGLVYQNTSPNTEFTIRIPAVFYHERFPEEDEDMELSAEIVTLNGVVKAQRRLVTDYLPYYFHRKLKLILKHQFKEMLNRQWIKEEGYEIAEGNRQGPLKQASCWLSEKEFVHRNVL